MSESEKDVLPRVFGSMGVHLCAHPGCNAAFSRPHRLKTHQLSHTGERPFMCDLCDKTFTRNAHLKRHTQINHQGQKTPSQHLKCEQCDGVFANKHSLKKHTKKVHSMKQYECPDCGKHFHKHHLLRSHVAEHKGTLPWVCAQCGKSYKYQMYLKRHLRTHKGYECPLCSTRLERWSDLQQHRLTEHSAEQETGPSERHSCSRCDRPFREAGMLRRHEAIHAETRQVFQCPRPFCPRYFYFKNNLAQHIKSYHEGQKFRCLQQSCGRKFYSKQRLLEHQRKEHSGEIKEKKTSKKGEQRRRRKDKGAFKKPMAMLLTGVEISSKQEINEMLEGEVRPLDSAENIVRETSGVIWSSSEVASEDELNKERLVQSEREDSGSRDQQNPSPSELSVLGLVARPTKQHFTKMWLHESDTDTDVDSELPTLSQRVSSQQSFDFSKFLKPNDA